MDEQETREILKRFELELRTTELEAQRLVKKVEALRGVVQNLRRVLGDDVPATQRALDSINLDVAKHLRTTQGDFVKAQMEVIDRALRSYGGATVSKMLDEPAVAVVRLPIDEPTPRGREAVRQVLIETRRTMHLDEIVADVKNRGWMRDLEDPHNAIAAAAKRLVSDGEIERDGRARFRYRLDKLPPVAEESPEQQALGVADD